jgi:hypothetical protein
MCPYNFFEMVVDEVFSLVIIIIMALQVIGYFKLDFYYAFSTCKMPSAYKSAKLLQNARTVKGYANRLR